MAAIAATAVAVWLTIHVLGSAPIPPALAGLAAGAAVLVSPRGGWLALSGITVILAVIEGHAGLAVVTVLALALPVLVMWRSAGAWPLAAGAPALGLIGLAGAWPALAARANTPWKRAGLAGIGWIWLALAAPVLDRVLYLPAIGGVPPSAGVGRLGNRDRRSDAVASAALGRVGAGACLGIGGPDPALAGTWPQGGRRSRPGRDLVSDAGRVRPRPS